MKITIENYRGIKSAAFHLSGISLIAAENAKGKSAIAQACGAVLSGTPIPISGIPKTMAGMLVNSGASGGFAQLDFEGGVARVDWPKSALKTKGENAPPFVSQIAAGIELLTPPASAVDSSEQQKRRAELLIEVLQAAPTIDDLRKRLAAEGIPVAVADNVWKAIEKQGFDGAHTQAKETGAQLKGQWRQVTGLNFGAKIAMNYVPKDWQPELATSSEETLQSGLTNARDSLESMIAITAIDDSEREKIEAVAGLLESREEEVAKRAAQMAECIEKGKEAAAKVAKIRNPNATTIHECPHCKAALSIAGDSIKPCAPPTPEEIEAWEAANLELTTLRESGRVILQAENEVKRLFLESREAAEKLAKLGTGNASAEQVEAARREVTEAETRLQAFMLKTKADRLLESINQNGVIVAALDTTGVRQDKLNERLSSFLSDEVNVRADIAGFSHVEIAPDMSLHYGGRAWAVLSESERFRVRILLQVSVANYDLSAAVVIDAADILDASGRNGLLKLLRHFGIPALICMTFPKIEQVPNLAKIGFGASYWIDNGTLTVCP